MDELTAAAMTGLSEKMRNLESRVVRLENAEKKRNDAKAFIEGQRSK